MVVLVGCRLWLWSVAPAAVAAVASKPFPQFDSSSSSYPNKFGATRQRGHFALAAALLLHAAIALRRNVVVAPVVGGCAAALVAAGLVAVGAIATSGLALGGARLLDDLVEAHLNLVGHFAGVV